MKPTALDRAIAWVAPRAALNRLRARAAFAEIQRHYEGATASPRLGGWIAPGSDANAAAAGPALDRLRNRARDLVRNNPYGRRAVTVIRNNTVGWGIRPKPLGVGKTGSKRLRELWARHCETTDIDADGRLNIYGIEALMMRTIAESGEVLVRRRRRRVDSGLAVPLQVQVLEPDFLDTSRDGPTSNGGFILQGVEFDKRGRRVAYWMFTEHPGSLLPIGRRYQSIRIPAEDVAHVYLVDRPGQVRGVSWFSPVILRLRDFDEFEDATLLRQKIAACFAAFVTDVDGSGRAIGQRDPKNPRIESIDPGTVYYTLPGEDVRFADPPSTGDYSGYTSDILHAVAAGFGITYEQMTGDYSQVNFASARMARLEFQQNVEDWRWNMLIPQGLDAIWRWFCEAAVIAGEIPDVVGVEWTPPPYQMIEPDREGRAVRDNIRSGLMTPSEAVRSYGFDPEEHFREWAEDARRFDELGLVLDCDPRRVSQQGQIQREAGNTSGDGEADGGSSGRGDNGDNEDQGG